jgi:hypothetical protein
MTASDAPDSGSQIAALITQFLADVSFPTGGKPDYSRLRGLFSEGSLLIKNSSELPEISTVDEFIRSRQAQVDTESLTRFEEVEIAHVTEIFGRVGHRFSTYWKRGMVDGVPIEARGIISIQFIQTPAGWRISSMAWDDERPGLSIPDRYL